MKGFQFIVEGNWGHFKKPETNNNPLSHDLITKTALIGIIGAVLGIEREEMKALFPQLSEDFLYGVQLLKPVKKVSWGFTSRKAIHPTGGGSPKFFEFLKNPGFMISLALANNRSESVFLEFKSAIEKDEAVYTPILGWHNCPAILKWHSEGYFSELQNGEFETKGFVLSDGCRLVYKTSEFRIGFDKIPTYQNDDFFNLPEKYQNVVYPDYPYSIHIKGNYYEYRTDERVEKCVLI